MCAWHLTPHAVVPRNVVQQIEAELIWRGRDVLIHNNLGKRRPPPVRWNLKHRGEAPDFSTFHD